MDEEHHLPPQPKLRPAPTLLKSFGHAFRGLFWAFRRERNLRIHAGIAIMVVALSWWLNLELAEVTILMLCIGFVTTAELMNTAIEEVVDLASPEWHPLAGHAKDCAAGAVLIGALTSLFAGALILGPALWLKFIPAS